MPKIKRVVALEMSDWQVIDHLVADGAGSVEKVISTLINNEIARHVYKLRYDIVIEEEDYDVLEKVAKKEGLSVKELVQKTVECFIDFNVAQQQ